MEKINIAELLKDCPKGMELDCVMYDTVKLIGVDKEEYAAYPIRVSRGDGNTMALTKYGQYANADFAKCVIFPKGKTTWEGFVPPCKFKDGDIIYVKSKKCGSVGFISIYKNESSSLFYDYCSVSLDTGNFYSDNAQGLIHKNDISISRLATEEEKQKLFDAIKANGYKWNAETKTLEKLLKFKVGDRVRNKNYKDYIYDIRDITDKGYRAKEIDSDYPIIILFGSQEDNYELVPNKFDITTLKPFESRVLVRDYDNQIWMPTFWGKYLEDDSNCSYLTTNGCYKYLIPYEGNEYLCGKTDDCSPFFKTWE